jgi:hypothetical protein
VRPAHVVAAVVVTLAVVAALGWLGPAAGPGAGTGAVPVQTSVVQVGAGETVWDVAQRVAPGSDPRAVVDRIRRLNNMVGSAVEPGQRLRVPDGR